MLGNRRPVRAVVGVLVAGLALGGLSLVGGGCGCGAAPVALVAPSSAPPPPAVPASSEVPPTSSGPSLDPVLADARLAAAAQLAEAQDFAGAGAALEKLANESAPGVDRLRWLYQAGRLYENAGRSADALRVFSACAALPWALTTYASYAAAQQALAAGRLDEAWTLARNAGSEAPLGPHAELLLADIQERRGAPAESIPTWRRHLASGAHPPRWAELSLKLAQSLASKQPAEPAALEEALTLARRVAIEQPAGASAKAAQALEQSLLSSLPADRRQALARRPEDELTRATALLDAGRIKDAEAVLGDLLNLPQRKGLGDEFVCKTASLDGKIKAKRKQRDAAVEAWGEAIQRCSGDARAAALYNGGGASASAGNHSEAIARYEQLEKDFPKNRLADDARLKGALEVLALGDEARFSTMLARIGEDYPEGDMATEGLFRLALLRMGKGDWAGAVAPLEASRKLHPHERDYRAAGRAEYFLARAFHATGDRGRAADLFREVIREQPLSFYMILAHARLAEANPSGAAEALTQAKSATPTAPPLELPRLESPAMQRAVELLRQGDFDLARAEISAAKLAGSSVEQQWTLANLYGKSGASVLAHAIPRGRVSDWLERYPEGGWRARWELAYPRPYLGVVQREAKRSGTPVSLAYAIMREESAFDPNAVSGAPAYGLMQFTMETAKTVGKKLGLPISEATVKQPTTSIALGCQYLADLRARHPDCPALAIPSYNAGPGATRRWIAQRPVEDFDLFVERIPYDETRNYTKRVLKSYAAYLYLYEPELLNEALRLPPRTQNPGSPAPEVE